jgi:uncharacterized protein
VNILGVPPTEPAQSRLPWRVMLVELVLRRRLLVIALTAIVVAALATGLPRLSFNPDSRMFFGSDNPDVVALEEFEATYSRSSSVSIIVAPRRGDVFDPAVLNAIDAIAAEAWRIPYAVRIDSLATFQQTKADDGDIIVEPLVSPDRVLDAAEAERIRNAAMGEPELVPRLVSRAGDVAAVNVTVAKPEDARLVVPAMAAAARELVAGWRQEYPELELRLVGGILVDATFAEAGQRDLTTLVPLMAVLLLAALAIGLRSLAGMAAAAAAVAATSVAAMGFAGHAGMGLNSATAGAPVCIAVLTIASVVHVYFNWQRACAAGHGPISSVAESIHINAGPIIVTNVTTAIGFLSLNASSSPPLRDLGTIVAFGVLFGMVICLTTLPALMTYLPARTMTHSRLPSRMLEAIARFIIPRPVPVVIAFAILLVPLGYGITRISLDDDYIRYFGRSFDLRKDAEFVESRLSGMNALDFSVPAANEGGIFDPHYLQTVDRFVEWLQAQPHVVAVDAITPVLKRINRTMNDDDPTHYRIPDSRELNAQHFLLYELALPAGHDLNAMIDVSRSQSRVVAVASGVTSTGVRDLATRAEQWLVDNAADMAAKATGPSVTFAYLSYRNIRSMLASTAAAVVLIVGCLFIALRSLRYGTLSILPNMIPAFMAFGVWGYAMGTVNLASSIVAAMTIGIVVDDSVHYLMKYMAARRSGLDVPEALCKVHYEVGPALGITTMAIAGGFLVLASSDFALNQHIGYLCAIVVTIAYIVDMLLLPATIVIADRWSAR